MYIINKLEVGRKLYTIVDEPLNKLFLEEFFFEISVDSPPHLQNHGFQICHGVGWGGVLVFDVGWIKIQFQMCHVGCPWMMSNYLSMDDGSWMSNKCPIICPWMSMDVRCGKNSRAGWVPAARIFQFFYGCTW